MTEDKFVTQEAFDIFVKSMSNKLAYLETITKNNIVRQETLLKLLCANKDVPDFNDFVYGLKKYDTFVLALREIRSISKMSERIDAALKYNATNPDAFQLMADDINVLEQAREAESISKINFDSVLKLPHTKLFATSLLAFLSKSE